MQKLIVMERNSKEELEQAIKKHLKDAEFRMVSLSVLKALDHFEAWILVEDHALAGFE
jgi:ATP phosphoribosyltransferase regulatory subunit HisZ